MECCSFIYGREYCPLGITPIEWVLIIAFLIGSMVLYRRYKHGNKKD
jgi:hypothetical protein